MAADTMFDFISRLKALYRARSFHVRHLITRKSRGS